MEEQRRKRKERLKRAKGEEEVKAETPVLKGKPETRHRKPIVRCNEEILKLHLEIRRKLKKDIAGVKMVPEKGKLKKNLKGKHLKKYFMISKSWL